VQDYRDRGYSPMGVLNYLARFGWSFGDQEIFSREELIQNFDWERVNKSDGKFDDKKFADVAFEHLKQARLTSSEHYIRQTLPFLHARGLGNPDANLLNRALPLIRERARTFKDAAEALDYFFRDLPEMDPAARDKFLKPEAEGILDCAHDSLSKLGDWVAPAIETSLAEAASNKKLELKQVAQPARVAVTGRSASPGLFEVMEVLGRDRTLNRLKEGARIAARVAS